MTARLAESSDTANPVVNHTLSSKQTQAEPAETRPNRGNNGNELATGFRTPVAAYMSRDQDGDRWDFVVCDDGSVWGQHISHDFAKWIEHEPIPGTRRKAECDAAERAGMEWGRAVRMDLSPEEAAQVTAWRVAALEQSGAYFDRYIAGDR